MKSISCIIPVFKLDDGQNWERFCSLIGSLALAAKSLIPDYYEVIIINDDPECKKFAEITTLLSKVGMIEFSKVLTNSQNMGQAYSRNKGSSEAHKEYLHFIDQDDFVNNVFYNALNNDTKVDMYIANPMFYLENSQKIIAGTTIFSRRMYQKTSHLEDLWPLLLSNIAYSPGQIIIKKSKFIAAGRFPILEYRGSDDYALFYNLALLNQTTTSFMKTAIFFYRIHMNQNIKILNMDNSINEFFASTVTKSFREKFIKNTKTSLLWRPLAKLSYTFFFRRVPKIDMK